MAEKKDAEDAKAAKEEAAAKELAEKEKPPPPPPAAADDSIGFHNIGDIVDEIVLEQNKEIEEKLETSRSSRSSMVDVTDAPTPAPAPTPKPKKKSCGGLDFGYMFSKPGALSAREPDVVWRSVGGERPRVFFDLSVGGQPAGRVVFELFPDSAPKSAENFRCSAPARRASAGIAVASSAIKAAPSTRLPAEWPCLAATSPQRIMAKAANRSTRVETMRIAPACLKARQSTIDRASSPWAIHTTSRQTTTRRSLWRRSRRRKRVRGRGRATGRALDRALRCICSPSRRASMVNIPSSASLSKGLTC